VLVYIRDPDGVWTLPPSTLAALEREFPEVRFIAPADRTEADARLPEADVVLGWAVTPRNFATAKRLRWIHVTAAGVGALLFPELAASEVAITNGRGLHSASMAEHTLGVMLAFARKLHLARDAQHERRWTQRDLWTGSPPFAALAGATLGVVGLGRVGEAVATGARALGMRVLAVRRRPAPAKGAAAASGSAAHEQWGLERLADLLAASDWVVLAAPLTADTRHLIGAPQLAHMKREAVLINLGRGALIDERALIAALAEGRIAGAGLDVFEDEPLPADSPLWGMSQVIVTPHISGLGPRYWERAMEQFASHLRAFIEHRALENLVDKRAGY